MKNYSERLSMALWVFSPIVIVLSIYTVYISAPIRKNVNVEITNSYDQAKKMQKSHSFRSGVETDKESAREM